MEKSPLIDDKWSERLALVVLPLTVLMFYATASAHFRYTPDDTFIYLQYARNFIHGNGISFNAGEPTYGFTGPLWMFIISLGGALGVDVYVAAKAIDLFFASLAVVVFYLLAYEVIRDIGVSMCATVAFSINVWFLRWAGSGMETSLSVLLVLAAVLFCLRNEYLLSVVVTALLTLVRPEACLLLSLIIVDIYINSIDREHAMKMIVVMIAVFIALLAPWLIYAYRMFGTIIPNTALVKSSVGIDFTDMGHEFMNSLKIVAVSDGITIAVLIVSGIVLFRQLMKDDASTDQHEEKIFLFRQSFVSLLWIVIIPVMYSVLRVQVVSRYFMIVIPLITVFAFAYLFRVLLKSRFNRFAYTGVMLFTGISLLQSQTVYYIIVKPGIEAFAQGMETSLTPIGEWLKKNTAPDAVVMSWDIGAVGYYSDRKICDAAGLATPEMISLTREGYTFNQMIEQKLYKPYYNVGYIVHRSDEPQEFKNNPGLLPLFTKPFYRMGLVKMQMMYYTLYKVVNDSSNTHSKEHVP